MEVVLGKIVSTFGLKGEVKVYSNTDFPQERYRKNNEVILYSPLTKERKIVRVASYRTIKGMDVVSFVDHLHINLIEKYVNWEILIQKPEEKLAEGQYYYADLLKMNVYVQQEYIGEIVEIIDAGRQKILRIRREGKKDLLYPFVDSFISEIDLLEKKMFLTPIKGMIDDEKN